jgi:hypothetical protein
LFFLKVESIDFLNLSFLRLLVSLFITQALDLTYQSEEEHLFVCAQSRLGIRIISSDLLGSSLRRNVRSGAELLDQLLGVVSLVCVDHATVDRPSSAPYSSRS